MDIDDLIMSAYRGSLPPGYLPADNPAFDADYLHQQALDAEVEEFMRYDGGRELLALLAVSRLIGGDVSAAVEQGLKEAIGCFCSTDAYDAALEQEPSASEAIRTLEALLERKVK